MIPVSEVHARDEFFNIKNITRDDLLAAHRVPLQLLGIAPSNAGGCGDVEKARKAFFELEIKPLQARLMHINHALGEEYFDLQKHATLLEHHGKEGITSDISIMLRSRSHTIL